MKKNNSLRFAGQSNQNQYAESGTQRVTLCCVTSQNHQLSEAALLRSMKGLTFARTLLISDSPPQDKSIDYLEIPKIQNIESYNYFILHELHKHIETDFVLLVQYDGFIINSQLWNARFLDFDYIGARWPWYQENAVGNGGFSLRSKRLLSATAKYFPRDSLSAEDDLICRVHRKFLENECGIIFAQAQIADQFSLEFVESTQASFGFHGIHHLHLAYGFVDVEKVINLLEKSTCKNSPMLVWLELLHSKELKGPYLKSLALRIRENQNDLILEKNCLIHGFDPLKIKQIIKEYAPVHDDPKKNYLCTVINYSIHDEKLINFCLKSIESFSDEIIVTYSDQLINGDSVSPDFINETIALNPKVHFIKMVDGIKQRTQALEAIKNQNFDWLLVINANEIADSTFIALTKILATIPYDSLQIKSYCYDQEYSWQSNQYNDTPILIKNSPQLFSHFYKNSSKDRFGFLLKNHAPDFHVAGENGAVPLFHQYNTHNDSQTSSLEFSKLDFTKEQLHFLIVAPSYTQKSAGIMVLHELTDALVSLGYKASLLFMTGSGFLVSESPDHFAPHLKKTLLREADQRGLVHKIINEGIVVYPEIIVGNPLGAPRVVRYFLNKDGVVSGVKSRAKEKDFCLAYHQSFWPQANDLLCIPITEECFNDFDTRPTMDREYDVTYIGKGHQYAATFIVTGTIEITRSWPESKTELATLLKGARYFYSWDTVSSTNIDAIRCGAIPVFLQWNQISREEIDKDDYGPYPHLLARIEDDKILVSNAHADFFKKRESYLALFDHKLKIKTVEVERVVKNICGFFETSHL